jgi:septation ring formation regulator EzrA
VQIKNSNELLATEINQSIDMNEVYAIATSELGMIQPTKDHIQYIETSQSSYTAQYDAINVPIDETEVTIGNVLGFIK